MPYMLLYAMVTACLFLTGCQTIDTSSTYSRSPAYETTFSAAPHIIQIYQPSYASTLHHCNLSDRMQTLIYENHSHDHLIDLQACLFSHNQWQMLHTLGPHLPIDLTPYLTHFLNPKKPIKTHNDSKNIASHIANAWSLHLQKKQNESLTHLALAIEASSEKNTLKPLLIQQFWLQIQLHGALNNLPKHHPSFTGWMDLLNIVQSPKHSIKRIQNWILIYPDHPANALIQKPVKHTLINTDHKALMLSPETPKPFMNAIQYGLLDAYWSNGGHHTTNGSMHFETHNSLSQSYQRILNQTTDIVIGPLMQQDIHTLFSTPARLPTITLNHHHAIKDPNVLQWSLSPLFELDQIKAYMREKGLHNTLVVYEKSPHYQEIADYFSTPAVDGQTTYLQAACETNWSNKQISDFLSSQLGISKSNQRWGHLERITDQRLAHSPRMRDDIDSVFIAGSKKTTARIISLLRYIAPKHLPIISSSNIHRPESHEDSSIDQVDFFDVLTSWDNLQEGKPSQGCHDTNRVHHFAHDAFALADQWPLWQAIPSAIYHGKSGPIFLDPRTQTATKILSKGKIIKGKAYRDKQYDFLLAKYQFLLKEALLNTYFSKDVSATK